MGVRAPRILVQVDATGYQQAAVKVDLDRGVPAIGQQAVDSVTRLHSSHPLSKCALNGAIAQSMYGTPHAHDAVRNSGRRKVIPQ